MRLSVSTMMLLLYEVATVTQVLSFSLSSETFKRPSSTCLQAQTQATNPSLQFDEKKADFCRGYLNKHHTDVLCLFAEAYSEIGLEQARRNSFSGGSYKIVNAQVTTVSPESMELEVTINDRSKPNPIVKSVTIALDSDVVLKKRGLVSLPKVPITDHNNQVENLVRKMNRLCHQVKRSDVTGKLIQMGIQFGSTLGALKENMWLNQIPHNRYVRQYFYDMVADATLEAVVMCSKGTISNRMKIVAMFPEMNPSMDSYRIGTLLEMARAVAIRLAEQNLRVRVCVQGSMGVGIFTGLPKQLSGVATILQRMDWQSGASEANEGMIGDYVNFGAIGKDHVVNAHIDANGRKVEQDDVFLLLCPQSMVGIESSIFGPLQEMTAAAGDRPVILINPDLSDKVSSQGQQSIRGRKQRMEFADSFQTIFHFSNLYMSGTSYFPILGSMTKLKPSEPWVAHQRRERMNGEGEIYVPVVSGEEKPDSDSMKMSFET